MKYHITLVLLSIGLHAVLAQSSKNYPEAFHLAEVWLEAQKDFDHLPAITALVMEDQEVKWKGSFGMANPNDGLEATPSTLFSICSISKLFTAVAIMKLYDEGKLRLDDKVSDLLPWYDLEQQYETSGPITVRGLLTHSAGLPREAAYPYWTGPDFPFPTTAQIKEKLGEQETLYPASTYFQYSNLGLTLLGEIVAQMSGQSYDDYVRQNILDPLGLDQTRTSMPEELYGQQLAVGYEALNRNRERAQVQLFQANGIKAAAGYSSNVEDLGQFAAWQFRLLEADEPEILHPATLKNMHRVHWTDPSWETTWGLGFSVRKDGKGGKVVRHGGSCPGYRSELALYPKTKMAFAVMINAGGTNPGQYGRGVMAILNKVEEASEGESLPEASTLEEYIGHYSTQPWWSETYVGSWQGKLVTLGLPSDSPGEAMTFFKHLEGDTFQRIRDDGEMGETLTFQRNDDNEVVSLERHGNYYPKVER